MWKEVGGKVTVDSKARDKVSKEEGSKRGHTK